MNEQPRELRDRVVMVAVSIVLLLVVGTVGYHILDPTRPPFIDALFETVVIITTLGMDILNLARASLSLKLFTIILIFLGAGVAAYAFTTLTAFVVEGELSDLLGRRRMDRMIARLKNHYIVCGAGRTGQYVVRNLEEAGVPFVVIDQDGARLREVSAGKPILYLAGNATEDAVLAAAGLSRAAGLLAALENDRDNLYLVITARHHNDRLRIVSRGYDLSADSKLKRAGADAVIYPEQIGGMRMVSEMVRPNVVEFLDAMLGENRHPIRFEEVVIHEENRHIGQSLEELKIRQKTGLLIVAYRIGEGEFVYNPPASTVLSVGMSLVAMGDAEQIRHLRSMLDEAPEGHFSWKIHPLSNHHGSHEPPQQVGAGSK